MRSLSDIEKTIGEMSFRTSKAVDDRILSDALSQLEQSINAPVESSGAISGGSRFNLISLVKITSAAAAVIIIAIIGLMKMADPSQPVGPVDPINPVTPPEGWVVLETEIPPPLYDGTPKNIVMPNLEKFPEKARPAFFVPTGCSNVAMNKPVDSTDNLPILGDMAMITDGDKSGIDGTFVEMGPHQQHITIDLQAEYDIYAVIVWHFHKRVAVYNDVIVQVANKADFKENVAMIFNNDHDNSYGLGAGAHMNYFETNEGKLIDAKGIRGRFIRLHSNGNHANELNHYTEVEVFALPPDDKVRPVRPQGTPNQKGPGFSGTPLN